MAHHHKKRFNPVHGTQENQSIEKMPTTIESAFTLDDELATEVDEPPDEEPISGPFSPHEPGTTLSRGSFTKMNPARLDRKRSLLSQVFAPSLELTTPDHSEDSAVHTTTLVRGPSNASSTSYVSVSSAAGLTSDGGLTSPARTNTPSPPPPVTDYAVPWGPLNKTMSPADMVVHGRNTPRRPIVNEHAEIPMNFPAMNTTLGRKPCIRFVCDGKDGIGNVTLHAAAGNSKNDENEKVEEKPKRPCALRFACPFKDTDQVKAINKPPETHRQSSPSPPSTAAISNVPGRPQATPILQSIGHTVSPPIPMRHTPATTNNNTGKAGGIDLGVREARRFHEFASSADEEDDWMNEKSDYAQKLTVNDTLEKEKSIQKLAEEVEEEDLEEADAQDEVDLEEIDSDAAEDEDDEDEDESVSDDGNETDDEGGFAESDDESDAGSEYQFWTPGLSTAATSIDPADHNRRHVRRPVSKPNLDSMASTASLKSRRHMSPSRSSGPRHQASVQIDTPPLPDSTDFVCGTLDEDRPLEDAYASCMEQRKKSAHPIVPQDIDPSFPTSDLDDDDDEDDSPMKDGKRNVRVKGDEDDSIGGHGHAERKAGYRGKSPIRSPKRFHSPPPLRRTALTRSPPPRRTIKNSPDFRRRPFPTQAIESRTPSHPSSTAVSPKDQSHIHNFQVARRSGLKRTTSLPRSSNPFYQQPRIHHTTAKGAHSRQSSPHGHRTRRFLQRKGAIDIVCGLEQKKQRRKEKAWFKFCQRGANRREWKPLPGQGAEKMRELGLERAGKNKGNGLLYNIAKYVVSI